MSLASFKLKPLPATIQGWHWWQGSGSYITLAVLAFTEVLTRLHWHVASPATLQLGAVIYSALSGGRRGGLVSALLVAAYSLVVVAAPGATPHDSVTGMLLLAVIAPLAAFAVGTLRDELAQTLPALQSLRRKHVRLQSQEQALRTAKAQMDEQMGFVSHELRSPLTSVRAAVQLSRLRLARWHDHPPADWPAQATALSDLLGTADHHVALLNRLIEDLLDATRVQSNKLTLNPAPADLVATVQDAVAAQRLAWPERIITLAAPAALPATVDATRIGQVVTNYLTNALKFAPAETSVAVTVAIEDGQARVAVRDHGPGLTVAQQAQVWERLYQVPQAVRSAGTVRGLGLGLYLCQAIITSHGGQVGVTSQPGQGATFWFTLPLAPSSISKGARCEAPGVYVVP